MEKTPPFKPLHLGGEPVPYGSLLELETAIELTRKLGMLEDVTELEQRTAELGKVLNGLRRSLVASHGSDTRVPEDSSEYAMIP